MPFTEFPNPAAWASAVTSTPSSRPVKEKNDPVLETIDSLVAAYDKPLDVKMKLGGLMRVEQGEIRLLSGSSGHYGPQAQHLLTVLQRLQTYQVRLDRIQIRRTIERASGKELELCEATEFVRSRGWPNGPETLRQMLWIRRVEAEKISSQGQVATSTVGTPMQPGRPTKT